MNTPYSEKRNHFQINDLNNVSLSNSNGNPLTYNGSNWVNSYDVKIDKDDNNMKIENSTYKSIRIGKTEEPSLNFNSSVSLGTYAGSVQFQEGNVAIGFSAAESNKGAYGVSVGYLASANAGDTDFTLAIGREAGYENQGTATVALGAYAGYLNQHNNTIIINATGGILNSVGTSRFYVKPVRQLNKGGGKVNGLYYDATTGEITYSGN